MITASTPSRRPKASTTSRMLGTVLPKVDAAAT
jgi:hypothetical protein